MYELSLLSKSDRVIVLYFYYSFILFLSIICTNFYIVTNSLKYMYRWLSIHCSEVSNKILSISRLVGVTATPMSQARLILR